MERVISYREAYDLVPAPPRWVPHEHPRGGVYETLDFRHAVKLMNVPVGVDNQIDWDGDIPADSGDDDGRDDGDVEMGNGDRDGNNTLMTGGGGGQANARPVYAGASLEDRLNKVCEFLRQVCVKSRRMYLRVVTTRWSDT